MQIVNLSHLGLSRWPAAITMALLCSTKLSVTDLLEPADMTQLTSLLLSARMTLYYIHYAGSLLHVGILAYASCKHVILPPVGRSIHRHAGSCSALGCLAPQSTLAPCPNRSAVATHSHTHMHNNSPRAWCGLRWLQRDPSPPPRPPLPPPEPAGVAGGGGGVEGGGQANPFPSLHHNHLHRAR